MYLQSLKLLQPMVKEMHLQENTFFDLDLKVNVTQNVAQCALQHVTYAVTTSKGLGLEEMHLQENTFFDLRIKVTRNIAKSVYIMGPIQLQSFGVTTCMSKGLEGDAFTRKYTPSVFSAP